MKIAMPNIKIAKVAAYLPSRIVTNEELEQMVNQHGTVVTPGSLEKLFGSRERRFAEPDEQVSDLAAKAALPIVEEFGRENIGYLIFAAASADLIEPATANIVQHKLGLNCPCFDLKNACNGFVDAITVGASLIQSGLCPNVLIVNGEKLSQAMRLDGLGFTQNHLAAYSLGDAGAAMLLTPSDDDSGIVFEKKLTRGAHWPLCTIKGGGSMYPRDPEKIFFEGDTAALKNVIGAEGFQFLLSSYQESGWSPDEVDFLFTHQVSVATFRTIELAAGVPADRIISVFEKFGNTAAASIPLSMQQTLQAGRLKKSDKVVLFGIGAGFSLSIQMLIW